MKFCINIMSKKKLICVNNEYQIFSKGCKIYIKNNITNKSSLILLPFSLTRRWLSYFYITRRLFRLEPRCGCFINEHLIIFSIKGKIYRLDLKTKKICVEHILKKGMNNPLSFVKIENIDGFDDGIMYGEYIGRGTNDTIDIYLRENSGIWKKVYSFPEKIVKHIHSIIPSKKQKCLFVLTGDSDFESGIWKIEPGFNKSSRIVGGNQEFRSCFAFEYENGLVYASDIPTKENYIYYLNYSNLSLTKLMSISGPCIYGTKLNNGDYIFSTSVEPDDNIQGVSSLFCLKKGIGVKDNKSHLYIGNPRKGFLDIYQKEKDVFPMLLLGLGVFQFPYNQSDEIYVTCQALRNLDGCTLKIDIK